jgi:hypothetical protein
MTGEQKKCPRCGLVLTSQDLIRCPRCHQLLVAPGCSGSCSQCGGVRKCIISDAT